MGRPFIRVTLCVTAVPIFLPLSAAQEPEKKAAQQPEEKKEEDKKSEEKSDA